MPNGIDLQEITMRSVNCSPYTSDGRLESCPRFGSSLAQMDEITDPLAAINPVHRRVARGITEGFLLSTNGAYV